MEALELQEAQEGGSGLVGREGRFRATLLVQAGHGGRGDHLGPTSLAIAGRCQALASWSTSWTGRWRSVAAAEARPGYGRQDLLLVVHRTTAVGLDRGRVVRRDHQGVDVGVRDRQAEVVADEPPALGAGILVAGARVLRDAVHLLARLLRIPGELRDPRVRADRDRGDRRLELVGRCARRVDVVVDRDRSRPGAPAVDRLRKPHVHLPPSGRPSPPVLRASYRWAFRLGAGHGVSCRCCWTLMLVAFAVSVASRW